MQSTERWDLVSASKERTARSTPATSTTAKEDAIVGRANAVVL